MNQIVNYNDYKSIVGLHRAFGSNWLYVGRSTRGITGSPLGNPFRPRNRGIGETIEQYRKWLWYQISIKKDEEILNELRKIKKTTVLVCWCHPNPCHAEVIAKAAKWLREQENI